MRRALGVAALILTQGACASRSRPPAAPAHAIEDDLYRVAVSLHHDAARANDRAMYRAAIGAYERLLAAYPYTTHAYDAFFYGAEARYTIEDWAGAAPRFRRAISLRPSGQQSEEAAYANVLATRYSQGLTPSSEDPRCPDADDGPPAPLPEKALPLLDAYDLYLATVDKAPDRPLILYSKMRLLWSCRHFSDAETLAAEIVDRWATAEVAAPAAAVLLDCLYRQGKREALFTRADALHEGPLAHDPTLAKTLDAIGKTKAARDGRRL